MFIGSSSLPPNAAPILHSPITDELAQGLCLHNVGLQSYEPYITMVGLSSCRAMTDPVSLWFFIISAAVALVLVAPLVLDNR